MVESVTELTGDNIGVKVIIFALPGHSTVDGKVKSVGKANECIDDENNVLDNIVINEAEAETKNNHYSHEKKKFLACWKVCEEQ